MSRRRPALRVVAPPPPEPASVRRLELNTLAAAFAVASALTNRLDARKRAVLAASDCALTSWARGTDLAALLGDLVVYACPAGAPADAAPRHRLPVGTFVRAFAVLSALFVARYLKARPVVVLAADERARAWWRAGVELVLGADYEVAVEATVAGMAHRVVRFSARPTADGRPVLVIADGLHLPAPSWPDILYRLEQTWLIGALPHVGPLPPTLLLALAPVGHVEGCDLGRRVGPVDALVGAAPAGDPIWATVAGGASYALRGRLGDLDERSVF